MGAWNVRGMHVRMCDAKVFGVEIHVTMLSDPEILNLDILDTHSRVHIGPR